MIEPRSQSLFLPGLKQQIVEMLKLCYDPEIPFNILDLGLVYGLEIDSDRNVNVKMTLTSPGCPVGPWLTDEITAACKSVIGVKQVSVEITFDPLWSREMMSNSAHKALGF